MKTRRKRSSKAKAPSRKRGKSGKHGKAGKAGKANAKAARRKKSALSAKTRKPVIAPRGAKPRRAVRARVRRTVALVTSAARAMNEGPRVESALAAAPAPARALTRGPAEAVDFLGVVKVTADAWGDGYSFFRVRSDLAGAYDVVRQRILDSGGIVTSSGGLRAVTTPATPGRSKTSLHYTARAIDLNVSSGMQSGTTPYIVVRDGGTDDHPLWKVYCEVTADGGEAEVLTLDALVWRKGQPPLVRPREVRCICLTDMFRDGGFERIPARSDWRTNYMSCEWWHFQNETGLVSGVSLFGDELKKVWPAADVDRSGLALNAVWGHQSFVVPTA
jgi:hypothetical protein